ncbi:GGDEF domain-containing protein [Thioalkalivibrio sp. XN8]|uniref:diguanylate cyclase n=1 Tax=Thioalkalivibrio sp. XN8 TaxID=2712863 RepID=UPI0013EB7E5D|nr:GGDEF domain-containing protein [Thioalkalivibrio sp. XN8]
MLTRLLRDLDAQVDQKELRGMARDTDAGAWLMLVLAGVYLLSPGAEVVYPQVVGVAFALYLCFALAIRWVPPLRRATRRRILVELLGMVAFVTVFLASVDAHAPLLLMLYLPPVIIAALALSRWYTLGITVFSVAGFLGATMVRAKGVLPPGGELVEIGVALAPFLLVAYVTAVLAHEVETAKERIRVLSETDELTGLCNLRSFSRQHRQEHERALRHRRAYAVVMMDLNGLKQINDTWGHEVGDRALILFANIIARLTRTTDAAGRIGGDEFAALLTETDAEQAARVVHRIRAAVERSTIEVGGHMLRLSVALGIATFPHDSEDSRELIAAADAAMYRDKEARRRELLAEVTSAGEVV